MAGSEYYDHTTYPSTGAAGSSSAMRAELELIESGFGKLPALAGNGGKVVTVNAGGTALEATEDMPTIIGVAAGNAQQVDQAVTATTRSATTTLGTTLKHTLSDTSTTVTAFNGVQGVTYHVRFLGAGNITHHPTNLIITQTGADITTAAGDTCDVYMLTATTCRIENYLRASGEPLGRTFTGLVNLAAGANIASAATIDLTAATGNCPRITGTTPTSAITMNTGQWELVVADGAWPLTYHASTNRLNIGESYTCTSGDVILYHKDLSGVVHGSIFSNMGLTSGSSVKVNQVVTPVTAAATTQLTGSLEQLISGATAITLFAGVTGVRYRCRVSSSFVLTHHATNLIITQTLANITTAGGDTFDVYMLTDSTCRVTNYTRANGRPLAYGPNYTSAQQTITAAGALSLAHGLASSPTLIAAELVCQTGEYGYTATDVLRISIGADNNGGANGKGMAVVAGSTNINIRFGDSATTFLGINWTTGAAVAFTNANWKLVIKAWL